MQVSINHWALWDQGGRHEGIILRQQNGSDGSSEQCLHGECRALKRKLVLFCIRQRKGDWSLENSYSKWDASRLPLNTQVSPDRNAGMTDSQTVCVHQDPRMPVMVLPPGMFSEPGIVTFLFVFFGPCQPHHHSVPPCPSLQRSVSHSPLLIPRIKLS